MNRTKVRARSGVAFREEFHPPKKWKSRFDALPSSFYIPNNHVPEAEIARKLHFIMKTKCRAQISFVSHRQFTGYFLFFKSTSTIKRWHHCFTTLFDSLLWRNMWAKRTVDSTGDLSWGWNPTQFYMDHFRNPWSITTIPPCDSPPTHGTQPSYLACCTMDLAAGQALYLHLST